MRRAISAQFEDLPRLEQALGYSFARLELLARALAHGSQAAAGVEGADHNKEECGEAGPQPGNLRQDNERLEFLGDAVLGLLVTEALYADFPDWPEGELTQLRSQLVNRQHLARVARELGLGDFIRMSREIERAGGRRNEYILANALEAVLAAMFLDAGGAAAGNPGQSGAGSLEAARSFVRAQVVGETARELAGELRSGSALGNFKSKLQEHLQATGAGMPVYFLKSESGPDHRKRFETEVRVRAGDGTVGEVLAAGAGNSRKRSEQEAARRALALMAEQALEEEPSQV